MENWWVSWQMSKLKQADILRRAEIGRRGRKASVCYLVEDTGAPPLRHRLGTALVALGLRLRGGVAMPTGELTGCGFSGSAS